MDINNIPDGNYIHIERWMYKLGLNMTEIAIYACIHGFCQDGISTFSGSNEYLQAWSGAGRSKVFSAIKKMMDMNLIGRTYVIFKGKPYPTYYTIKSREMYSNIARLNRQNSLQEGMTFDSPKNGLESKNKTESVQKMDGHSPEFGPNNIANNIFKNIAAAENDDSGKSESNSTAGFKTAAAAIISQKISENLGSDPFPQEFISQIENAVLVAGLTDKDIPEYVSFACERAKAKNPKNIYGLFKSIASAVDVITDFKETRKVEEKKQAELFECPVCHQKHSKYLDSCIRCGFSIGDRNNPEKIKQQQQIYNLPEDIKQKFDQETRENILAYDFRSLMKPEVRAERISKQQEIYKKYGIPFIEGEL